MVCDSKLHYKLYFMRKNLCKYEKKFACSRVNFCLQQIPIISTLSALSGLKVYQNGNYIEPSEQRLQEISIAKN